MANISRVVNPIMEYFMHEFYPTFVENAVKRTSAPVQNAIVGTHMAVTGMSAVYGGNIGAATGSIIVYDKAKDAGPLSFLKYPLAGTAFLFCGVTVGISSTVFGFLTPITTPIGLVVGGILTTNPIGLVVDGISNLKIS